MPSIFPECDQLKQIYDKCFTSFFQKFISPDYSPSSVSNPCEQLHEDYRKCVEQHLENNKLYDIDLEELRKEVLNTENDRLKSQQDTRTE